MKKIIIAGLWASLLCANYASADGTQTFEKILLTPQLADVGDTVKYRFALACNSLTSDCGNLTITDTVPDELEVISCNVPSGFTVVTCSGQTINITKDTVFNGGDSFIIDIDTRIKLGTPAGASIINTGTSVISAPTDPANGSLDSSADEVTVEAAGLRWTLKKDRISPATNLQPTWDTDVTYRVQLCSDSAIGNVNIAGAQMIDTIPAGAVVVNAGGGTYDAGSNEITWSLGDLDLADLYNGQSYGSEQCLSHTYTLRYPQAAGFNDKTEITNSLRSGGTPDGVTCDGTPNSFCDPVEITEEIGIPTPGAGLGKSANDVLNGAAGSPMIWNVNANVNNSNAPVPDLVIYEQLPTTPANLEAISVTSGQWNSPATTNAPIGSDVRATISYSTDAGACNDPAVTYPNVLANDIASPASVDTYTLPANTTCVRWAFRDAAADGPAVPRGWAFSTAPRLQLDTENVAGPYPVPVENCLLATYTEFDGSTGVSGPRCATARVEEETPHIDFLKTQLTGGNNVRPGDEIQYRLRIQHDQQNSTAATVNPVIADLLPAEFEFVSWDANNVPNGKAAPNMEKIDDYNGTGRTLLRFSWAATAPANSTQIDGLAGVANPESFAENERADVLFTIRIKAGTAPGNYSNTGVFFDNSPRFTCSRQGTDDNDLDGDTDTGEMICYRDDDLMVVSAAVLGGAKWVKGDPALSHIDDPMTNPAINDALCPDNGDGFTRFPCVARTEHGGDYTYLLELTNMGNENLTDYIMYDVLPAINDTGVGQPLSEMQRGTTWVGTLKEALIPMDAYTTAAMTQAGAVIEYSLSETPCRPEMSSGSDESGWQTGCDNDWTATVTDFSAVKAFRIKVPYADAPYWQPSERLHFQVNMQAPASGFPSIPGDPNVFNPTWNSIAHRVTQQSNGQRLPTAEPRQVGVVLPEGYRLGNLVWADSNGNGIAENGENGIANVELQLFHDNDGTAGASAGDTLIGTTITDANGKYAFGGLEAGDYFVMVTDPLNQAALVGISSSTNGEEASPNDDGDNNDNGVNTVTIGAVTGLASGIVTLGTGSSEPTNEVLRNGSGTDDDNDLYPDVLSNLSVDFGFVQVVDRGDALDPSHPTLQANNGARHVLGSNVYLGECVDADDDGQPSADAEGDDSQASGFVVGTCQNGDDEDGVTFPAMEQGSQAELTIVANEACLLNAWIDWNSNGDWSDVGEQIANDRALSAGTNSVSIVIPDDLLDDPMQARFRCSSAGGDTPTGLAADGEVEDYLVQTQASVPDLALRKQVSQQQVRYGEDFTYTLTLTRTGPGQADNIVVNDRLPNELEFVSANPSVGSYDETTGDWTIPSLAGGTQAVLTITVRLRR
jgi:uncharacterized repeat protein (TIGR01451 family)